MNHILLFQISALKKTSPCRKLSFIELHLYRSSWQGKPTVDAVRKDFDKPKKNGFLSLKEHQKLKKKNKKIPEDIILVKQKIFLSFFIWIIYTSAVEVLWTEGL